MTINTEKTGGNNGTCHAEAREMPLFHHLNMLSQRRTFWNKLAMTLVESRSETF